MDVSLLQTGFLVFVVFMAGFVDSIAGGGGLISLPAYFAAGLPAHAALATNKFSSFMGTLAATYRYYRAGRMKLKLGLSAAAGALAGSAAGSRVALLLDGKTINTLVLTLIPAVLVFFIIKDRIFRSPDKGIEHKKNKYTSRQETAISTVIGTAVGFYDGLFGPGTGAFLTLGFNFFLRMDLVSASGNARLANLASNFGALAVFAFSGNILFPLALFTAAGGIAGNMLGSRLALKKGERIIKPFMVIVLLILLAEVIRQRIS